MRLLPVPGVFQPPSDAWMLIRYMEDERLAAGADVLDLCTGSGALAIAAARQGASEVTAVDISRRAVAAVRLNALVNRARVRAVRGDLFAAVAGRRFDLIVSNPPYLPGEVSELPHRGLARATEGGRSGRAFLDRIAARAAAHLTEHGTVLLVYSSVCNEPETLEALRAGGLSPRVVLRHRGPLGPHLTARVDWLRAHGLLLEGDEEEILVVRAERAPVSALAR
ncbi:MAG TPA: HemK2/MTQ2 family protein methyltransferase [Solirubrobacteraceae bacterium]|nr:HemK2/MTQ2 family protein methyltransferase [Solirubrobacteraceae bacterium]